MGTPEGVSEALVNALDIKQVKRIKDNLGEDRFKSLVSSLKSVNRSSTVTSFKGSLEAEFVHELKKDEGNFKLTIKKYGKILEALESLAKKPVIVIGMAQTLVSLARERKTT